MKQAATDVTALYINCSLKLHRDESHTQRLMDRSTKIMRAAGVQADEIYALDHQIAFGMIKDGKEQDQPDDWPMIQQKIMAADILVIGTPIWLGDKSSVATLVIERLYAYSSDLNQKGQYAYYGKVGGCMVTGNEDGIKHCARDVLFALQHIGYTIPPQADSGWVGEAGPGVSYGDMEWQGKKLDSPAGLNNEFTNRNVTFMTWNLIHMARLLKQNDGLPAYGNTTDGWRDVLNATS